MLAAIEMISGDPPIVTVWFTAAAVLLILTITSTSTSKSSAGMTALFTEILATKAPAIPPRVTRMMPDAIVTVT